MSWTEVVVNAPTPALAQKCCGIEIGISRAVQCSAGVESGQDLPIFLEAALVLNLVRPG